MGPTAKRSSDPHDAAPEAGTGTPKTATAPRPAESTPISQGRQMTAATRVAPRATPRARQVALQSPNSNEESRRASAGQDHDDGGGGHERDQHRLEQAEGHDAAQHAVATGPGGEPPATEGARRSPSRSGPPVGSVRPAGTAGTPKGAVPVARNRRASTQGAPA